jgi:hypothetical protein
MIAREDVVCYSAPVDGVVASGVGIYEQSPTSVKLQCILDISAQEQILRKLPDDDDGSENATTHARCGLSVRFDLDANNCVRSDFIEPDIWLTEEDIERLWWMKQEIFQVYEEARAVVTYYRNYRSDYLKDFIELFSMCAKSPKSLRKSSFGDPESREAARGLERHIHDILPKYRNKFIATLLDIQDKIPSDMSPDLRDRILCAKSLQLSKPSRALATFIGQQDSSEVAALIREELEHPSGRF